MELEDKLAELLDEGFDYDYIDGYEAGYYSPLSKEEMEAHLINIRNDGIGYSYVDGYEDGYMGNH